MSSKQDDKANTTGLSRRELLIGGAAAIGATTIPFAGFGALDGFVSNPTHPNHPMIYLKTGTPDPDPETLKERQETRSQATVDGLKSGAKVGLGVGLTATVAGATALAVKNALKDSTDKTKDLEF